MTDTTQEIAAHFAKLATNLTDIATRYEQVMAPEDTGMLRMVAVLAQTISSLAHQSTEPTPVSR